LKSSFIEDFLIPILPQIEAAVEESTEDSYGERITERIKRIKDEIVEGRILPFGWATARIHSTEYRTCLIILSYVPSRFPP
jgi:hypothetical protein